MLFAVLRYMNGVIFYGTRIARMTRIFCVPSMCQPVKCHTEITEIFNVTQKSRKSQKRFWLKIIFKILVKISSIFDAIPIKILPESEVFERILVKDFSLKIIFGIASQDVLE